MCGKDERGANKTQIVYLCYINFHTVVPNPELLIRKGLTEWRDAEEMRYKTTTSGMQVLGCFRQIEEAILEMASEGDGAT